jgi:la-related protein 1
MWAKGQGQRQSLSQDNIDELYTTVHERALRHRRSSEFGETHAEMEQLYEFWSHFLCRNFNPTMYSEFKKFAAEDTDRKAMAGMSHLINYYDETLKSQNKTISDLLAHDYIELVKQELARSDNSNRLAFGKLQLLWRNNILLPESRMKIENLIAPELREELER